MQQNSAAYMLHEKETHSNEALELLARKILQLGSAAVVLQGGIVTKASFTDVLVEKTKQHTFILDLAFIDRITHGSGGAFTSACCCYLCAGNSVEQAIGKASDYMCQLICVLPTLILAQMSDCSTIAAICHNKQFPTECWNYTTNLWITLLPIIVKRAKCVSMPMR